MEGRVGAHDMGDVPTGRQQMGGVWDGEGGTAPMGDFTLRGVAYKLQSCLCLILEAKVAARWEKFAGGGGVRCAVTSKAPTKDAQTRPPHKKRGRARGQAHMQCPLRTAGRATFGSEYAANMDAKTQWFGQKKLPE